VQCDNFNDISVEYKNTFDKLEEKIGVLSKNDFTIDEFMAFLDKYDIDQIKDQFTKEIKIVEFELQSIANGNNCYFSFVIDNVLKK
jgi:hypothetical protein